MSQAYSGGPDGQATRRNAGALWAADRLSLAAAPTFAIMALLVLRGGLLLCSATRDASLLSGMVPMYERLPFCYRHPKRISSMAVWILNRLNATKR